MGKGNEIKEYRSFGLMVGGIFGLIGLWPMVVRGQELRLWALILGGLLMILGLLVPACLQPLYRVWMRVGAVLGWFNTRLILAIGFYGIFTPIGWGMRLLGQDPMRRRFDPNANSYRVVRSARPGAHMQKQF